MPEVLKQQVVDQRAAPRRPIHCKVKILDPKGQSINGVSFDLSTSGIGVILDFQLANGEICTIMFAPFTHGSIKSVTVKAAVAYSMLNSAGFRTGFRFLNISAAMTTVITSIIG